MRTRTIAIAIMLAALTVTSFNNVWSQEEKPLRDFQVSILPAIGTSGSDAINYRYKFSLNLFAGITGGLDGFEAGGFLNLNKGDVKGAQLSGFGNVVHGDVEGLQLSGFMNITNGNTDGFHGAGFVNFASGNSEGFSGAGFINVNGGSYKGFAGAGFANIAGGSMEGFQASGFANVTGGSFEGFQASGFANVTGGNFKGFQASGFVNVAGGNAEGFQVAGFGNVAGGDVKGPVIAGFMNVNRDIEGVQLSGFLNVANRVKGLQLGFLNIADTVDGVPIGFLSIVKKGGYRQIELAGSDVMHLGASFRIGVPVFYNIFSYGTRIFSDEVVSGFGYGVGTEIRLSDATALQIEAHNTQLQKDNKWYSDGTDQVSELRVTVDTRLAGRLQLFAGPVLYNQFSKNIAADGIAGADISSYTIYERHWNDYVSKWWIGGRGGLRFRLN